MEIPMAGAAAPGTLSPEAKADLDRLVAEHDIVLFMKGSPEQPRCGFSARAAAALDRLGHPYHAINVFEYGDDPFGTIRALAEWASFPTLPQVWVKGELIGGSDVALEMVESGELAQMLEKEQ